MRPHSRPPFSEQTVTRHCTPARDIELESGTRNLGRAGRCPLEFVQVK